MKQTRNARPRRAVLSGIGRPERLDPRLLPAVVVGPIQTVEGQYISGRVAEFATGDVPGAADSITALVDWGDGSTSTAKVQTVTDPAETLAVVLPADQAHAYALNGVFPVTVSLTAASGEVARGVGEASISAATVNGSGDVIAPTLWKSFSGEVASFSVANPLRKATDFSAAVNWGDGQASAGQVVLDSPGRFHVDASHTYASTPAGGQNAYPVSVVLSEKGVASPVVITAQAVVSQGDASVNPVIAGRLARFSDTGVSSSDGITSTPFPTFLGTAPPYTVVLLYARRFDYKVETLVGRTMTGADGSWQMTVGPLPDGPYTIRAAAAVPGADLQPDYLYSEVSPLVIDTVGLAVAKVERLRNQPILRVYLQPDQSGFDLPTLTVPQNYTLQRGRRNGLPVGSALSATIEPVTSEYVTVDVRFGSELRRPGTLLAISGIRDVAGNTLVGSFPINTHAYPTRLRRYP